MTEVTDPVCQMKIDPETAEELGAIVLEHEGKRHYFCCLTCADAFQSEPVRYA